MNERILELMTKAGFDVEKLRMYPGGWPREDLLVLQDFAELIVKYCATICNTVSGDSVSNASKDYQEGREMGAIICRNQILKYFGVEE